MTIKILIADDHAVVAEGLKHLIDAQPELEVIGIVPDGREAVRMAKEAQPDVVLMDLSMPELNGADATRAILERDPKCRVIVLSMYAEREYVRRALKAGAAGYVVKRSAATMDATFSNAWRACASKSFGASLVRGSTPACPEMNTISPDAATACE